LGEGQKGLKLIVGYTLFILALQSHTGCSLWIKTNINILYRKILVTFLKGVCSSQVRNASVRTSRLHTFGVVALQILKRILLACLNQAKCCYGTDTGPSWRTDSITHLIDAQCRHIIRLAMSREQHSRQHKEIHQLLNHIYPRTHNRDKHKPLESLQLPQTNTKPEVRMAR